MAGFTSLADDLNCELIRILDYWELVAVDDLHGGFIGQIDMNNIKNYEAPKGLILNSRILWTFSAAFGFNSDKRYRVIAERSFNYLINHFYDDTNQGFYWSVKNDGSVNDPKKHIYAQAFCIYGLSEYYRISNDKKALILAQQTYKLIKNKGKDTLSGGYLESFSVDWSPMSDLRLSDKDINLPKTMNTHLHVVEALSNLYEVWNDEELRLEIVDVLQIIDHHFIDHEKFHLKLFFDFEWKEYPDMISYGHDVEASWLLLRCAEISGDEHMLSVFKDLAVKMIDASIEAIDKDGGLWYEFDLATKKMIREKHWWPQAEFMIGSMNAYQLTRDEKYGDLCFNNWNFIKGNILTKDADWSWGIDSEGNKLEDKDMVGFWKCPYHNTRMCLELLQRIKLLQL